MVYGTRDSKAVCRMKKWEMWLLVMAMVLGSDCDMTERERERDRQRDIQSDNN